MNRLYYYTMLTIALLIVLVGTGCSKAVAPNDAIKHVDNPENSDSIIYTAIEWTDLLPDEDLNALENPPEYLEAIEDGSEADQLVSQLKTKPLADNDTINNASEDRYQQALSSKNIRPEFDKRPIRIPGFIVPLEFDDNQTITTFFVVPFFGACIHMPPPPPNQIIYAEYGAGLKLEALYDPFWIEVIVSTQLIENDLATAAYSIKVFNVEPYTQEAPVEWDENIETDIDKSEFVE